MFGCVISIVVERASAFVVPNALYIARLVAGFCLIANGAYIGLGWVNRAGDAGEMLRLGSPLWLLILFGVVACGIGLWYWHLASYRFGSGEHPVAAIPRAHAVCLLAGGVLLNVLAFIIGDRGI